VQSSRLSPFGSCAHISSGISKEKGDILHTLGNGQVRPRGITTSQKYDRIFHTYIHKQASLPPFESDIMKY
jgi:hypothetical protein